MLSSRFFPVALFSFFGVIFATCVSVQAQRSTLPRFEYAVINGSYSPYPSEGPGSIAAAVNICYLRATGCENEEVRLALSLSKFVQDEKLENNANAKALAESRSVQAAYSKAIAKLGADGWEMLAPPAGLNFDLFYTDPQGVPSVKQAATRTPGSIWFKRVRQ